MTTPSSTEKCTYALHQNAKAQPLSYRPLKPSRQLTADTLSVAKTIGGIPPQKETSSIDKSTRFLITVDSQQLQALEYRYRELSPSEKRQWDGVDKKFNEFLAENNGTIYLELSLPLLKEIASNTVLFKSLETHQFVYEIFFFLEANLGRLSLVEVEALYRKSPPDVRALIKSVCANVNIERNDYTDTVVIRFLNSLVEPMPILPLEIQQVVLGKLCCGVVSSLQSIFLAYNPKTKSIEEKKAK